MKLNLLIALLLAWMAPRAQELFQWPKEGAYLHQISPNLAQVTNVVVTLSRRLDSLTHAFQSMHDSLMRLEREIHEAPKWPDYSPGFAIPDSIFRRPYFPASDSMYFLRPKVRIVLGDAPYISSAPKKKRRKG